MRRGIGSLIALGLSLTLMPYLKASALKLQLKMSKSIKTPPILRKGVSCSGSIALLVTALRPGATDRWPPN